jgi:hypothetical protein
MAPSRPRPLIAARNTSGFSTRLQRSFWPRGVSRSKSSTCSPNGPTAKWFLPWMFIDAQPASVGNMVPGTTAGQ